MLFTSDVHGMDWAFERFADLLRSGDYDAGILGGDLVDEWMSDEEVIRLLGIPSEQLIDELPGEDEDPTAAWNASEHLRLHNEALALRIRGIEALLETARLPILIVLGNHDKSPWPDTRYITDIHMRRVAIGGVAFAGYRWTTMDRSPEDCEADMRDLQDLVDRDTVLISHSPPWGILDGKRSWGENYGLKALNMLHPKPYLHLVGHVHSLAGRRGRVINGCWPTVRRFFEIDVRKRKLRMIDPTAAAPRRQA